MHVVKHHGFSTIIMGCRVGLVSLKEPVRKQMFVPNVPNQACWRIRCCFPALKKPESRWPEPDQWQICSYGAHFSLSGDSKPVSFWSSLFFLPSCFHLLCHSRASGPHGSAFGNSFCWLLLGAEGGWRPWWQRGGRVRSHSRPACFDCEGWWLLFSALKLQRQVSFLFPRFV